MTARVVARHAGVRFLLDRQNRPVTPAMARIRRRCTSRWALRGVSLEIGPGESVGLVGGNGAGKTTLLRLLAGVLAPDEGEVMVTGRVGSLLSIEAGLMPRLTGRENALLLGVLAGLTRTAARDGLPLIQEESGLGSAFDRPVATYSQGMAARLGFAVIDRADPDVLLLDEVFEAVDEDFRREVRHRVHGLCERGGIVVVAGHDHAALASLCETAVVLADSALVRSRPLSAGAVSGTVEEFA